MYEITVISEFTAAHALRLDDGSLEPSHDHIWPVQVTVAAERLVALVDEVEEALARNFDREVDAIEIGRAVAERLKHLDRVAYVRYASVYKRFRDLGDLLEEVREVIESTAPPESPEQGRLF